jgi:hypothetical protein
MLGTRLHSVHYLILICWLVCLLACIGQVQHQGSTSNQVMGEESGSVKQLSKKERHDRVVYAKRGLVPLISPARNATGGGYI